MSPSDSHPWHEDERARLARRGMLPKRTGLRHHGEWRCTHFLVYEDDKLAELYQWRGAFYTAEQYACGEPGYTRRDLREGETIESAFTAGDE